jgi:hypothetical protein
MRFAGRGTHTQHDTGGGEIPQAPQRETGITGWVIFPKPLDICLPARRRRAAFPARRTDEVIELWDDAHL